MDTGNGAWIFLSHPVHICLPTQLACIARVIIRSQTNGEDDGKKKSEVSPPVADLGSDAQWASQERDVRSPQPDLM